MGAYPRSVRQPVQDGRGRAGGYHPRPRSWSCSRSGAWGRSGLPAATYLDSIGFFIFPVPEGPMTQG